MTGDQLRERLAAMGYITAVQGAEALYGPDPDAAPGAHKKQPNVSNWLAGKYPVPDWVDRTLELIERDPPVILSGAMRWCLNRAKNPGDPLPMPKMEDAPFYARRTPWPELYAAMEAMGAIEGEEHRLTQKGYDAL